MTNLPSLPTPAFFIFGQHTRCVVGQSFSAITCLGWMTYLVDSRSKFSTNISICLVGRPSHSGKPLTYGCPPRPQRSWQPMARNSFDHIETMSLTIASTIARHRNEVNDAIKSSRSNGRTEVRDNDGFKLQVACNAGPIYHANCHANRSIALVLLAPHRGSIASMAQRRGTALPSTVLQSPLFKSAHPAVHDIH